MWEERFFNSLALRFGRCEEIDEETEDGSRFDVVRFRVLTSYPGPIEQTVNVFIGGDDFPITVMEERFGSVDGVGMDYVDGNWGCQMVGVLAVDIFPLL